MKYDRPTAYRELRSTVMWMSTAKMCRPTAMNGCEIYRRTIDSSWGFSCVERVAVEYYICCCSCQPLAPTQWIICVGE